MKQSSQTTPKSPSHSEHLVGNGVLLGNLHVLGLLALGVGEVTVLLELGASLHKHKKERVDSVIERTICDDQDKTKLPSKVKIGYVRRPKHGNGCRAPEPEPQP